MQQRFPQRRVSNGWLEEVSAGMYDSGFVWHFRTKEKSNKDNIVVEMKSDNTEEAVLLGVNGEKQPPSD